MLQETQIIKTGYSHSVSTDVNVSPKQIIKKAKAVAHFPSKDWADLIVKVSRDKDTSAFQQLFGHFAPRIKAYLMKSGADVTMAEECTQEAMATLWHKAHLFDPSRATASTWVFTIARNKRIDAIRKQRRPEPDELLWPSESEPEQEDIVELKQQSDLLSKALETLPQKQRQLVEHAYFLDMSHSEIATKTGLPLGTIKSRIRLALEKLRHAMD